MHNKSKEFISCLKSIANYWLNLNLSKEETVDGVIFSICSMIDGESGMNNFQHIKLSTSRCKDFNENDWLHEQLNNIKPMIGRNK